MCELWVYSWCFEFLLKGDTGLIRLNELNYAKYTHVALVIVISWRKLKRLNYFSDYAICSDYDTKAGVARVYSQSKPQ